jgi:hypothetical protein
LAPSEERAGVSCPCQRPVATVAGILGEELVSVIEDDVCVDVGVGIEEEQGSFHFIDEYAQEFTKVKINFSLHPPALY